METKHLRREVERLGAPVRGRRFPEDLKRRLVAAVSQLRGQGLGWIAIGDALGIAGETARRWHDQAPSAAAIVPVEVVDDEEVFEGVAVVSPEGYRVEGLTVQEAAALLRALR